MENPKIQTNSEIRQLSRGQLSGKWGGAVAVTFAYMVIASVISNIPIPGTMVGPFGDGLFLGQVFMLPILSTLLSGALAIGLILYHLNIAKNEEPRFENLFDGFKQFIQSIIASVLTSLLTIIGLAFFIIPGIIIWLGLSQTFYIMADNPGISGIDAMKESWEMTKGYRGQYFLLALSFIPWAILTIFTLFIGMLWLLPYMYVSFSNFYLQLRGEDNGMEIGDLLVG